MIIKNYDLLWDGKFTAHAQLLYVNFIKYAILMKTNYAICNSKCFGHKNTDEKNVTWHISRIRHLANSASVFDHFGHESYHFTIPTIAYLVQHQILHKKKSGRFNPLSGDKSANFSIRSHGLRN